MSDTSLDDQVEIIEEYVEAIGDEVVHKDTVEAESAEIPIIVCFHGDSRYQIVSSIDHPSFDIVYRHDVFLQLGQSMGLDQVSDILDEEIDDSREILDISPDTIDRFESEEHEEGEIIVQNAENRETAPPQIRAAKRLMSEMNEQVRERFAFKLFQELSYPEVATTINRTDGVFRGFTIRRKIFPEDEGFNLTEFNHSVQSVLSVGTFGDNSIARLISSETELQEEFEESG